MAEKSSEDERTCASCEKALHGKLLSCSNCQQACYCNRDCQKIHWPMHKIRCKQMQKAKQAAIANNQKRLHKLLLEWKNECREIMIDCLLGHFGREAMASMEPQRRIVFFKVDFDYNFNTFVPTEPPIITPVDDFVPGPDAAQIHRLYDEAKQMHAQPPTNLPSHMRNLVFAPVISYIEYIGGNNNDNNNNNNRQVLIHTNMVDLDDDVPEVSFDDMVYELKHNVTLTSKKFSKWESLREKNIQKQINAVQQNENFAPFVSSVLQMRSSEPKNSTHAIMIEVKLGFGLGEIISLEKYNIVKMKEAKKEIKRRKVKIGDLLNQGGNENNAIVVFSSGGTSRMDIYHVLSMGNNIIEPPMPPPPNSGPKLLTVNESNDQAIAAFDALCRIKLPSIQTPDLH